MTRPFPCLLALAAVQALAILPAQTVVLPPGFDSTEGTTSSAYPWGRGNSFIRVQYIYDTAQFASFGVAGPVLVTGCRFRANGGASNGAGTYNNVTVDVSSSVNDYLTPNLAFDQNHGPDRLNVQNGSVPVAACAGTTPNNWYVDLNFSAPFVYDPTLGNDFLIDVVIPAGSLSGSTPGAVDLEGVFTNPASINGCRIWTTTATSTTATSGIQAIVAVIDLKLSGYAGREAFGSGCGTPALTLGATRPVFGSTASLDVANLPNGSGLGAVALGFTGFQPGIDLTPLGMPGCSQYASVDSIAVFVPAGTTQSTPLPVPNMPSLTGLQVYAQALAFANGANPLGLISSNGMALRPGL